MLRVSRSSDGPQPVAPKRLTLCDKVLDLHCPNCWSSGVKRGLASLATKPRFCLLAADLGQLEADELPGVAQRHTVLEDEVSGTPNLVL